MEEFCKKPSIRFSGFTHDWEQRKFGDNFKLSQGLQVSIDDQYYEQLTNYEQFIRIIDVTQESEPPRYVFNPTGKGRVKKDDLFFVRYGAVGTIGHGYNGVIANNLFKVEPLFKAHNMFLFQQFSGTYFNEKLKEMSASTSMPAINFGALNNLMFQCTSYKEQVKIGTYFYRLDNLITLHQRKLKEIELLKKTLLNKLFPNNGNKNPDYRFTGFTEDWEQRNFGSFTSTRRGLTYKPNDVDINGVLVLRSSNIKDDKFVLNNDDVYVNEKCVDIEYVKQNDILITSANGSSRLVGKNALIPKLPVKAVHGGFMLLASSAEPNFVKALMSSLWYRKLIYNNIYGGNGAIGNLRQADLSNSFVNVPSLSEQVHLGKLFNRFDKTITLHQRKTEQLELLKKYLLKNMFV